jgi:hypothetical protein
MIWTEEGEKTIYETSILDKKSQRERNKFAKTFVS